MVGKPSRDWGMVGKLFPSPPTPLFTPNLGGRWANKERAGGGRGRESLCTWCMCFFNVNDEKICYGAKVFSKSLELVKFEKEWRSGTTSKIQHQWPVAWNRNGTISDQSFTHSIYFTSICFRLNPVLFISPSKMDQGHSEEEQKLRKQNLGEGGASLLLYKVRGFIMRS